MLRISLCEAQGFVFFSSGYWDVSLPRVRPPYSARKLEIRISKFETISKSKWPKFKIWICFEFRISYFGFPCEARRKPCWARLGFPHSEIPGSQVASHLPGAYRRHATSFIASISRDIHHRPLISVVSKFPKWIWRTLNCQRAILSLSTLSIPSF